jgi:uncharacterized protein (TIGR03382 family)
MRALILFCALAGRAMAGLIVTADPSTSATYPANTTFDGEKSQSADPLGPFSNVSVQFKGWNSGGSHESLDGNPCSGSNGCLVFDYLLTFSSPVNIQSITFTGDAFNGATFALFDVTNSHLFGDSVSTGNVGHPVSFTLDTPGAVGTSFSLQLFDTSTVWTYVSDIVINTTPEPATSTLVFAGLGVLGWATRRRSRI